MALFGLATCLPRPAAASEVLAGMHCGRAGYSVVDPIYMGRTYTGLEQWACASRSGINMKRPPFPVLVCDGLMQCRHVGWTY